MWGLRHALLSALFALLLLLPSAGYCSATYEVTEEQLTALEQNLTALQQNNQELMTLLSESESDLTAASSESAELRAQLEAVEIQLSTLKQELTQARSESETALQSLATANDELAKASASFKQFEKEHARTENNLRTQKTLWQIVAIILGGVAIAK